MKAFLITPIVIGVLSYICFINQEFLYKAASYLHNLANRYKYGQYYLNLFFKNAPTDNSKENLFTREELSKFVRKDEKLYLSIVGRVFDVTKGKKYYGPGESYHSFTGRDASKAFITGDFSDTGLTDDISDLSLSDLNGLRDWIKLYEKDYIYKGKLIGRFYDENGMPTPYLKEIEIKFLEAEALSEQNEKYKLKYPPCNIEWSQEKGSRVWCSNKSGGIKRDWVGVPRKLFMPGWSEYKCACIRDITEKVINGGTLKEYDNCKAKSSCFIGND